MIGSLQCSSDSPPLPQNLAPTYRPGLVLFLLLRWMQLQLPEGSPEPRCSHAAAQVGDQLVIHGGLDARSNPMSDTWILRLPHAAAGPAQWTRVAAAGPTPPPLFAHAAFAYAGQFVLFGGQSSTVLPSCSPMYALCPASLQWRAVELPPLPRALVHGQAQGQRGAQETQALFVKHAAVVAGPYLLVVGGGAVCFSFGSVFSPTYCLCLEPPEGGTPSRRRSLSAAVALPALDALETARVAGAVYAGWYVWVYVCAHLLKTESSTRV